MRKRYVDRRLKVKLNKDGNVAPDRTGWQQVVCGLCSTGSNRSIFPLPRFVFF